MYKGWEELREGVRRFVQGMGGVERGSEEVGTRGGRSLKDGRRPKFGVRQGTLEGQEGFSVILETGGWGLAGWKELIGWEMCF